MKLKTGTKVRVIGATDSTANGDYIGKFGIIIEHNANGETGNTKEDPLHVVEFEDGTQESYWFEELRIVHAIISNAEDFEEFVSERAEEINARCIANGAQCFNDKITVINEILAESKIEVDFEGEWAEDIDELIIANS